MSAPSLYEQLLGERFARLDKELQQFHRQAIAEGAGRFAVIRPRGALLWFLGWCMGLPPPARDVPLRLRVEATPRGEIWRRWFDRHSVVTVQRLWRGTLIEAGGPVQLGLDVRTRRGGMTMRARRAWLLGVPLPRWLSPRVTAVELPVRGGWLVRVRIELPLVGEVARYEGQVTFASLGSAHVGPPG